jgi:hypothetical protein
MSSQSSELAALAGLLRDARTLLSPLVNDPDEQAPLGALAATGPRAASAPEEYSLLVEAIREGYLLHYGTPRLIDGADPDLRLLAGDYLYALGLERLARLGDDAAVSELSDLISLCAELHAEGRAELAPPLWLAAVAAVGNGESEGLDLAKRRARELDPNATNLLWEAAQEAAGAKSGELTRAAEAIDFTPP